MTLDAIAGTSFLLGLSGAVMPGPLLTLTISESVRRGLKAAPLLMGGHALLEAVVVLLLFFGLGDLVQRPGVFSTVALTGGLMLLWMGSAMLRGLPRLTLKLEGREGSGLHPLIAGAVVSLANPYFILWWATVGLGYLVVAHEAGVAGILIFYLFHILSDFVWYAFVSGAVTFGRRLLGDFSYRVLVCSCALFILSFGIYFGYRGVQALTG